MTTKKVSFESASAFDFAAVTPSDTVNFTVPGNGDIRTTRGLYVGSGGNVVAVTRGNVAITFTGVLAGSILPIQCIRVNSTSTTATGIVALF